MPFSASARIGEEEIIKANNGFQNLGDRDPGRNSEMGLGL
jgi:hypothetical protein